MTGLRPLVRTAPRLQPPARPRGQALPVALVFMLAIAALAYYMINAGQRVVEKMRATNAADAAAYSAAIVEARALNYDAVSNRAMIANQMAIAQIVSLVSWANYFGTGVDRFVESGAVVNAWKFNDTQPNGLRAMSSLAEVGVATAVFGGTQYASAWFGGNVSEWVQKYSGYLGVAIKAHDMATDALSTSQTLMHDTFVAGDPARKIVDEIVERTDRTLRAEIIRPTHGFLAFTRAYGRASWNGDERGRFAEVASNARDAFMRQRNWTAEAVDIPFYRKDVSLRKRGGTDLVGYDEWRAVDTLEYHARRFGCGRFHHQWCGDAPASAGWGASEIDAGQGDRGAGHHGNAYNDNPTTARAAESIMIGSAQFRQAAFGASVFHGLPSTRELADLQSKRPSTGVSVRVVKAQADTVTSGNAARVAPTGRLALYGGAALQGELAALARAEVYFDRVAARADGRSEIGSLYGPYWRVRLIAPLQADRAWAATRQGGVGLP